MMQLKHCDNIIILYSSRQNPYPPHGRSSEIPRGRRVLQAKLLEAKFETKVEFPARGRGVQNKKVLLGE